MRKPVVLVVLLGAAVAAVALVLRGTDDVAPIEGALDGAPDDGAGPAAPRAAGGSAVGTPSGSTPRTASPTAAGTGGADAPERPVARVTGRVADAASRAPIVGGTVELEVRPAPVENADPAEDLGWIPTGRSTTTDDDGQFVLDAPAAGPVRLVARTDVHVAAAVETVAPAEGVRVELRTGRTLDVEVVREGLGTPIAGALVAEHAAPGAGSAAAAIAHRTDDAGRARLVVSPDRRASVYVTHPSCFPAAVGVPTAEGEPLRVALRTAFRVYVDVTTADGRPPRGLVGFATRYEGGSAQGHGDAARPLEPPSAGPADDRALSRGATALLRFPAHGGSAAVQVQARGYRLRASERFEVPRDGGATRVAIALERDPEVGRVVVTLADPAGGPVPADDGVVARLRRIDGGPLQAGDPAVEDGAIVFDGLAPGAYRLTAAAAGHGPAVADVEIAAGAEARAEARFVEEARLRIRLVEPPQRKANVRVTVDGVPVWVSVVEDPAGRAKPSQVAVSGVLSWVFLVGPEGVTVGSLPPGKATVEVVSPDLLAGPATADLAPGRTEAVELKARVR